MNEIDKRKEELAKTLPEGLIRITIPPQSPISSADRALLIRKANAFMNDGKVEMAKRIFLTVHYSAGIINVGDVYFKENRFPEAMALYMAAPDPVRVEKLAARMADMLRFWMEEEGEGEKA